MTEQRTSNLVSALRELELSVPRKDRQDIFREAADEIERLTWELDFEKASRASWIMQYDRLRAALEEFLLLHSSDPACVEAVSIAREALRGGK